MSAWRAQLPRRILLPAAFLAAGLVLFFRTLTIPLVADDWEFLILVDRARSIAVCFDLLVGRFVRPLVMLTYYGGYKAFGLWPLPFHLAVVVLHSVNAWLLCLLTRRLDRRHRLWVGAATGFLFLAFAGHSEAVSWVAGLADPIVACCLFGLLLVEEQAIGRGPAPGWTAIGWLLTALGLLGKESAVVLPAVAAVYALARGVEVRRVLRRAAGPALIVAAYLIVRVRTYGVPTDAYGGLGGHAGSLFANGRALVIRAFLPPSNRVAEAWLAGHDLPWVLVATALIILVAFRSGNRRALIFAACALALTLAPALPLSISLATSESERMIYIPTAFAAIVTVLAIDALPLRAAVTGTLLALLIGGHALLLQRMHARWRAAGEVFDGVTRSFVAETRLHDPGPGGLVFLLSLPDNVRGAYVFRRGFVARLHFLAPDLEAKAASIVAIESQILSRPDDVVAVRQLGPASFALDVTPNMFLSVQPPLRPFYTFPQWSRTSYVVAFTPAVGRAVVLQVSGGRARFVADLAGPGAPFGSIDIPADGAACDRTVRFSGWALDDREVTDIVARYVTAGGGAHTAAAPPPIAHGTWARGTRPDVAAAYAGFPLTDRAEWDVLLPCAALAAPPGLPARIEIVALDADGHETPLGSRTVLPSPLK
jgi:hypothetical protein